MFIKITAIFRRTMTAMLVTALYGGVVGAANPSSFEALHASASDVEQLRAKWADALATRQQLVDRMVALDAQARAQGTSLGTVAAREADGAFNRAWSADQNAFVQVQNALTQTWQRALQKSSPQANSLLREPLLLAVETTEYEMRMGLGTKMKTELPALKGLSQNDLLADALISRYARAVVVSTNPEAGGLALGQIARELALLSQAQMISFDSSLARSEEAVLAQLRVAGDTVVSERYVWLMAPVNLLVLDIGKQRGPRCQTQQWFTKHHHELVKLMKRFGWPTQKVYLYNRVVGELDGFLPTKNTAAGPTGAGRRYIELSVLLDSLVDPRALGLGDCALSGMVTRQPQALAGRTTTPSVPGFAFAGQRRYVCPAFACSGTAPGRSSKGPLPGAGKDAHGASIVDAILQARWTSLDKTDLRQMRSFCALETGAQQGEPPRPTATCDFLDVFNAQSDPYDHYLTCTLQAMNAGGASGSLTLGVQDLGGVPVDPSCRFAGDGASSTAPAQTEEEKKKAEEAARLKEQQEAADRLRKQQAELQKQLDEAWAKNCLLNPPCTPAGHPAAPSGGAVTSTTPPPAAAPTERAGGSSSAPADPAEHNSQPGSDGYLTNNKDEAPPGTQPNSEGLYFVPDGYSSINFGDVDKCLALPSNEAASCLDALVNTAQHQVDLATRSHNEDMRKRWRGNLDYAKSARAKFHREAAAASRRTSGGIRLPLKPNECDSDPARCNSSCGGIAAQLQAGNACTSAYLDSLLSASGRPSRTGAMHQPWSDPRKAFPRPWSDIDAPPSADSCGGLTSASGGAAPQTNPACGLVACANPSTPTAGTMGCCGASAAASNRALRDTRCDAMRCVDETCNCLQSTRSTTVLDLPMTSVAETRPLGGRTRLEVPRR